MTNTKLKLRASVDSLYLSGRGDRVRIRTHFDRRGATYAIWSNGKFVGHYGRKTDVRAYIVNNDCHAVESFDER